MEVTARRGDDLAPFLRIPIHQGSAADAQIGPVLEHARGDRWNVGDIRAAEPERVARTHLLCLGAESKARSRGNTEPESDPKHQPGLTKCLGHCATPLC